MTVPSATLEDTVYVKPVSEKIENGLVFSHFVDSNNMPIKVDSSLYEVYYSSENGYHSTELPTEAGWYSLVVKLNEDSGLNLIDNTNPYHTWFVFQVLDVVKEDPEVLFSIESGVTLVIGEDSAPTVTVPEGVEYRIYYTLDGVEISEEMPTTPGTYAINIQTVENDIYKAYWGFRWFKLVEPTKKVDPEVTFSIESGVTLVIGEDSAPTVTVPEGVEYEVYYTMNDGAINLGSEFPTTPGVYAINIRTVENDTYNSVGGFRWFNLSTPASAETVMVSLVYEADVNGVYRFVGFVDADGNSVEIDSNLYSIWYEQDEKTKDESEFVAGQTYSLVVKFTDGANYRFISEGHIGNETKAWPWFTYTPAA